MHTLTDPAFIRYKYTSYLLLAGAFLLALAVLLKTGNISEASLIYPPDPPAAALSSAATR